MGFINITDNKNYSNFYKIIAARMTSYFGSFLSLIALNIYVLELTDSPSWVAVMMGTRMLSAIILNPLTGYLVDRFDRKKMMIFSDFTLFFLVVLLIAVPMSFKVYYLIFLMFFLGVLGNLFDICLKASIPSILDEESSLRANSILHGGMNLVAGLSSVLAILSHVLFESFSIIFIIDGASYLISGFVLLGLRVKTGGSDKEADTEKKDILEESFFKRFKKEYKTVLMLDNSKIISICFFILFFDALGSASHSVGFPVFSRELSPEKPMFFYGIILFFWAMGNIAGIIMVNKASVLKKLKPENLYFLFTGLMAFGMIMIFQTEIFYFIIISAFVAGIGDGTYQTYFTTYIQQVDDSVRGKVFGLSETILKTGFGIGFVLVPLVLGMLPVKYTVAVFHFPSIFIVAVFFLIKPLKKKFVDSAAGNRSI